MSEETTNNAETLLAAGAATGEPRTPGALIYDLDNGTPYVVVPYGYAIKDLEDLLPNPVRKRAAVTLLDADSFIAYAKKHGSLDTCVLYADVDYEHSKCGILAVIDDHGSDTDHARWREHTAYFAPKLSLEWRRWTENDGKSRAKTQAEFAAFIEDNLGDIATMDGMPTGTEMLTMALGFEANSDKRFKRKIDLQSGGVHLEFVDQADEATSEKMRLFERFTIGIPVFQGASEAYPVEARLKFRQNADKLTFWYELIRPDRVFKQAVTDTIGKIGNDTGLQLLYGNAGLK